MCLRYTGYEALLTMTCFRRAFKCLSVSNCRCCNGRTLSGGLSSATKSRRKAVPDRLLATTTTLPFCKFTNEFCTTQAVTRHKSTSISPMRQLQCTNKLFPHEWKYCAASTKSKYVFRPGAERCSLFSLSWNKYYGTDSNDATCGGDKNDKQLHIVDGQVNDWLVEMRADFQNEKSVSSSIIKNTEEQTTSSSSSDSDSDGHSTSDSELDVEEYTPLRKEGNGRTVKMMRNKITVPTDIQQHSQLYADVSEYAKRIAGQDDAADMADSLTDASSHWSNSTITIEEFSDYESDEHYEEEDKPSYVPPIPLTRGVDGVFDLDDLVTFLSTSNAIDLCVIKVPKDHHYVDYLLILTAKSPRHNNAMTEDIKWIYKRRKGQKDPTLMLEKGDNWTAMDLGNIALHMFLPDARAKYDIETLWTCGEEFDEKSQEADADQYAFLVPPHTDIPDMPADGIAEDQTTGQNTGKNLS